MRHVRWSKHVEYIGEPNVWLRSPWKPPDRLCNASLLTGPPQSWPLDEDLEVSDVLRMGLALCAVLLGVVYAFARLSKGL